MRLSILPLAYVDELRKGLDSEERIEEYQSSGGPAIDEARLIPTPLELPSDCPNWARDERGIPGPDQDAENSIRVYEWLGDALTAGQASDPRLWTTLSHVHCREYTLQRWGVPDSSKNRKRHIDRHWFTAASGRAKLRVQAIARLWWAAQLTHAPWKQDRRLEKFRSSDPFRFTRLLFTSQQVNFDIVERTFGSNLRLRICVLDALGETFPDVASPDSLSKAVSKELNLLLRSRQIDILGVDEQRRVLGEIVQRCANRLD